VPGSSLVEPGGEFDAICSEMPDSPVERTRGIPGRPLPSFPAGASVVRREAHPAAGGFSARLWLGGEEELLAPALARAGWHMSYVPDVPARHQASRLRDAHLRRRHGMRNTLWFTWLRRLLEDMQPNGRARNRVS
jgi:hypothetical protein